MKTRDPSAVDAELVKLALDLSRRAGRPAGEAEVRSALAPLSPAEEETLREARPEAVPASPLGPMAWADIARGVEPETAAARELSGYYALLAERDTLASLLQARGKTSSAQPATSAASRTTPPERTPTPARTATSARTAAPAPSAPPRRAAKVAKAELKIAPRGKLAAAQSGRAEQILGLFAYHRDAPLVARELRLSMSELQLEIDSLKLRRKTSRLVNGLDIELPMAARLPGASGPGVRRRSPAEAKARSAAKAALSGEVAKESADISLAPAPKKQASALSDPAKKRSAKPAGEEEEAAKPAAGAELAEQSTQLRALLREVGPRRDALAARLGSPGKPLPINVLLARFRAAGLEREFGQRERDLIRALLSRNRTALQPVASELQLSLEGLAAFIQERGLTREVEAAREAQRGKLRERNSSRDRVDQVLRQGDWLADLGLLAELDAETAELTRAALEAAHSRGLRGPRAVDALHDELRVSLADIRALLARYKLR